MCIRRTPKKNTKTAITAPTNTHKRHTVRNTPLALYTYAAHTHTHYIQDHKRIDGKRACVSLIWRFQILWCIAFHLSKVERKQVLLFILFFNRQKRCCRMNEKKLFSFFFVLFRSFSFFFVLFRSEYNTLSALAKGKFSMPFALAFIYLFILLLIPGKGKKKEATWRACVEVTRRIFTFLHNDLSINRRLSGAVQQRHLPSPIRGPVPSAGDFRFLTKK